MKIAIIGAGIGGLASAALLARSGHDVSVFETFEKATPVGAGLLLQPPGQAVLNSLGLLGEANSSGQHISRLHSLTTDGKTLLDLSYRDLQGGLRNGLGIQREALHSILLCKALEVGSTINYSTPVTAIDRKNDRIFVVSSTERFGPFDIVIVSSGSRSEWLKGEEFGRTATPYSWGCMWATVPLPKSLDTGTLHQRCRGTRKMIGLLPTGQRDEEHSAALYWSVETHQEKSWRSDGYKQFLDELHSLWPDAATAASCVSEGAFSFARYQDVWTKRPYGPQILLIGDAAHGTSPQLGQGASMALLDAFVVTRCFQEFPNNPEAAMKQYRALRLGHQRYVRYASRALTPVFQHKSRLIGVMRDRLFGPFSSLPFANKLAVRTLACEMFNGLNTDA